MVSPEKSSTTIPVNDAAGTAMVFDSTKFLSRNFNINDAKNKIIPKEGTYIKRSP
ncbi:MAG: hypothetical protein IPK10_03880 [Bacteroidetes bacterium]|nr:hypothetical protein [Bacteroidota bacterium]